ncbi:MAG: LmeA family phospholipid-binding protein [Anaerolineae bacterium]
MRFTVGCLIGAVAGILLAALAVAGYLFFNTRENLPLFPVAPAGAGDVTITIGEAYINDQMRTTLAARGMNITNPSFDLHAPNRATASGDLAFVVLGAPVTVRPTVNMHFGLSNGQVTFDLDQVSVSGFSVPQNIVNQQVGNFKQAIQDQVNADLKRWLANTGLRIVGVEATETNLIVKLAR